MVDIKIGKREFRAVPTTGLIPYLPKEPQLKDARTRRVHEMLEGRNPEQTRTWTCPEGPWKSGPKGAFKDVEPRMHFFGYPLIEVASGIPPADAPPGLPLPNTMPTYRDATDAEVREASLRMLKKTMAACGFDTFDALAKELFAKFGGAETHPYDLDNVLSAEEKAKYSWKVTVTLRFRHFALFDWPRIDPDGELFLSVPDRIEYSCIQTAECTEEGKKPAMVLSPGVRHTLIRAATEDVFRIRKGDLDDEIQKQKAVIEEARRKMEEAQKKRDAIKPQEQ